MNKINKFKKLIKDLDKLDFKDIMLQRYVTGREAIGEIYDSYNKGIHLIGSAGCGFYALSDQEYFSLLVEIIGPYTVMKGNTYRILLNDRDNQLNRKRKTKAEYSEYLAKLINIYNHTEDKG
jgi:hypothetical protein